MKYIWIIAGVVCIVGAASAWFAFQRPDFMVGFIAAAVSSFMGYFGPKLFKRMSAEQESKLHQAGREGLRWNPWKKKPDEWGR